MDNLVSFLIEKIILFLWNLPISSANPPTGTRQVPVTNCNNLALFSLSVLVTN